MNGHLPNYRPIMMLKNYELKRDPSHVHATYRHLHALSIIQLQHFRLLNVSSFTLVRNLFNSETINEKNRSPLLGPIIHSKN